MDAFRLRFHALQHSPISLLLILLLTTGLSTLSVSAQIPETVSYQGHLVGEDGRSASDGIYQIEVLLYDKPEGGSPLWSETHRAYLSGGVFSLSLGSLNPLSLPFDRPYWLGFSVAGDVEMTPRTELASSPYAFRSAVAGSLEGGAVSSINGIDGPVRIVGGGATTVTEIDGVITILTAAPKELQGGPKVEIAPNSAQTSSANKAILHLNENGGSTPNLIEMEVGGSDVFVVENDGDLTTNGTVASSGLVNSGTTTLGDGIGADNLAVNVGTGTVSFTGARLQNVADPTAAQDAATRKYVDDEIAALGSSGGEPYLTFGAGSSELTDNRVVGAGTGVSITDAGVDNGAYTISIGQDVATSASPTFDGVTVTTNGTIGANLFVADDAFVGGDATVNGDLTVQGETLMLDALTVGDDLEVVDDLDVGGEASIAGDLSVSGTVNLPAGSIDNAELANASIDVDYAPGISGDASVVLGGTLNLQNTGVISVTGTLNQVNVSAATGGVTLSLPQNIDASASPTFDGVTVTTNGSVGANLTVGDDLFVNGDMTANGELTVDEITTVGDVEVGESLDVAQDLDVNGDGEIAGNLEIGDDLEVGGDFEVSGSTTLDGTTTVNATLEIESSGTALHIKDGGLRLSTNTYTAKDVAPDVIGTDAAVAIVNAFSGVGTKMIGVPTTGSTGMMIVVTNSTTTAVDLTGTAAGTVTIPNGEGVSILYDGASWIVIR